MNVNQTSLIAFIFVLFTHFSAAAQEKSSSAEDTDGKFAEAELILQKADGFKGIWYMNQPSNDEYVYKYSGGLATYPANHRPFAIYSKEVNKTFFCFGGTDSTNSTLLHTISFFDHKTKKVANPTILLDKKTTDAHDNPVISIDDKGYIWIFSTSHGITRPSYIHKSKKPFDITDFETIKATETINGAEQEFNNFSYFQVYFIKGKGLSRCLRNIIKPVTALSDTIPVRMESIGTSGRFWRISKTVTIRLARNQMGKLVWLLIITQKVKG